MGPFLPQAGFSEVQRFFKPGKGLVSLLWGTEIVLARKTKA